MGNWQVFWCLFYKVVSWVTMTSSGSSKVKEWFSSEYKRLTYESCSRTLEKIVLPTFNNTKSEIVEDVVIWNYRSKKAQNRKGEQLQTWDSR